MTVFAHIFHYIKAATHMPKRPYWHISNSWLPCNAVYSISQHDEAGELGKPSSDPLQANDLKACLLHGKH